MQEKLDHEGEGESVGDALSATTGTLENMVEGKEKVAVAVADNEEVRNGNASVDSPANDQATTPPTPTEAVAPTPAPPPKIKHKMLLHNNDNELLRVEEVRRCSITISPIGPSSLILWVLF